MIAFMILKEHLGCCVKSGWFWGQSGHQKTREEALASIQAGGVVMGTRLAVVMGTERGNRSAAPGGHLTVLKDNGDYIACQLRSQPL